MLLDHGSGPFRQNVDATVRLVNGIATGWNDDGGFVFGHGRRAGDAAMRAATFAATMASNAEAAAVEAYKWKRAVPVSFNTRAQKAKRARR